MEQYIDLYHGSLEPNGLQKILKVTPENPHHLRSNTDFGPGLYCTPRKNQAMEWAVRAGHDGSLSSFTLNLDGLKILNLDFAHVSPLNWIAEILHNRSYPEVSRRDRAYCISNWRINPKGYDIILGYTVDDQYNKILRDFLNSIVSFQGFCEAIMLGDFGYQYVIRSDKAYDQLYQQEKNLVVRHNIFRVNALTKLRRAKTIHEKILREHSTRQSSELFFDKIISYRMRPEDVCFPFNDIPDFFPIKTTCKETLKEQSTQRSGIFFSEEIIFKIEPEREVLSCPYEEI